MTMRIGVVNDLLMIRRYLRQIIERDPSLEVAWEAENGREAVDRCREDLPDLVLMDLIMPVMDGVSATREIMQKTPCPILVVTASVGTNASLVFEAMGGGALDAVNTPRASSEEGSPYHYQALLDKIAVIRRLRTRTPSVSLSAPASKVAGEWPLVVIGASTGGPSALATVLEDLPSPLRAAVVIVQHVDAQFAPGLAKWLSEKSGLSVEVAQEGQRVQIGTVSIAGGSQHLVFDRDQRLNYRSDLPSTSYCPSIDLFFASVAEQWPRHPRSCAILMTGMGRDGAQGLLQLHEAGWHTVAQEASSCVVSGMPRAAIELGAASEVLNPEQIASLLRQRLGGHQ